MVSLIVVLLGWMALSQLAVDLMPDMTFPVVSVTTLYRGAGPYEVETLVTRPMEQALSSVSGVEQLSSSSAEGSSSVRVRLQWGTDVDAAVNDMRSAIDRMRQQQQTLPGEIETPFIRKYDITDSPIIYMGLGSSLDPIAVTRLAETQIVPRLERITGVARVRVRGGARREIQVDMDRGKLEALDMGVTEVVQALRRENVTQPTGDIEQGHLNHIIRSRGEFRTLDEVANTVVRERDGAIVRVCDVADVIDGEERRTEMTRINGQPGLMVYIYRQSGANTVDTSNLVHKAVAELNRNLTGQAELNIRVDKSDFIRQAIENVRAAALLGMGLSVVVLIVFLRSFRSALVIAVSMPLSVLATFVLIYSQGYTLNMVSFGGLALGIGLLVDNSIVVLESIFRKRDEGLDAKTAAIDGTQEVASAIVASTLTTLIVFVPLLFVQGMTGIMLHQLAAVVSFSLLSSLLASLTLTPALTVHWLGLGDAKTKRPPSLPLRTLRGMSGVFHRGSQNAFGWVEAAYSRMLGWSMRNRSMVVALLLGVFAISLALLPRIGTEFIPQTDEGDLRIDANMAAGIQLQALSRQAQRIEQIVIDNVHEAATIATFIGDGADDADDWNRTWFRMSLPPRTQRDRGIEEIRKSLDDAIGPLAGTKVRVRTQSNSQMSRMLSSDADIEVEIRGHDIDAAEQLAGIVAERMRKVRGLVNVDIEKEDRRPELQATINRTKASLAGISVQDVTDALATTIRGSDATVYREAGDEFNILVRLKQTDRADRRDVGEVGIATPTEGVTSLKSFVQFDATNSPLTINRLDQQRITVVSADVEDRDLGSVVADLQSGLDRIALPDGLSINIAGDWEEQQASFQSLTRGFVLAILLMYMVMASQFESLRDPLLILVSIPLGGVGVVLMLVSTGTTLNVQSYIGLVMLSGIVVNNAIVLVDYINKRRRLEPSLPLSQIIHGAGVRRFRPIMMTTLTTILAMSPIALGWGEGGELQAPMARVVIGGLASGTLITMFAIPLLATLFARKVDATATKIADSTT